MTSPFEGFYSLDVEADGPCAGLYSMVSIGLVPVSAPDRGFYATLAPVSDRYIPESLAACGFTREQTLAFQPAAEAMRALADWAAQEPGRGRKIVWSDNPAFDWQFLNYYCHAFLGNNPFGRSARRIGDYSAGREGDPRATQTWKRHRTEAHTHNALEDARGNAGAMVHLLQPKPVPMPRALVCAYDLEIPAGRMARAARIERTTDRQSAILWAVRDAAGDCLNRAGDWEFEPQPSARDEAFLKRCRWDTPEAAYAAWEQTCCPAPTDRPSISKHRR